MSWMTDQWEEEYIEDTQTKIQDAMLEYYEELEPNTNNGMILNYMLLSDQYGLPDREIGRSSPTQPTAIQEYEAYIKVLSLRGSDVLKFWEAQCTHDSP
ncbi:hypothetical protein EDB84DRAFT_1562098 [Lactarius hengduanensis]|nr:hypothetical protein EDB84DRAFT_1562098 [Lactarius hengduanensis]